MSYLTAIFPRLEGRRVLATRDQAVLLMAAFNEIMLGVDTYLAHVLNHTIRPREWIPIIFGPSAGVLLLIAGLIAFRKRNVASWLATFVFLASMVVGVLGAYFHVVRGSLPSAAMGEQISVALLVWAPPVFAPFAFAGIGVMGMSAAWIERPYNSGILQLPGGRQIQMPYSKTRAYFMLVSLGILMALVSSALDHARHWGNPWFWLPLVVGVFAAVVAFGAGAIRERLNEQDVVIYFVAMLLMVLVGVLGLYFHVQADLTSQSVIVPERFLRGAPFMSPLLYTNMGLLGWLVLLDPLEE